MACIIPKAFHEKQRQRGTKFLNSFSPLKKALIAAVIDRCPNKQEVAAYFGMKSSTLSNHFRQIKESLGIIEEGSRAKWLKKQTPDFRRKMQVFE